jgi:hypothetical protein
MPLCQKPVVYGWPVASLRMVGRCGEPPNGSRSRRPRQVVGPAATAVMARRGWRIAARDRIAAQLGHRRVPSGASLRSVFCAVGDRRESATCWGCILRRCIGCSPAMAWPNCGGWIVPPGRVIRRMEPAHCGEIVHVDVKKLGRIPAGGGWRMLGRTVGNRNSKADRSSGRHNKYRNPTHGHHFLHTAIDGHSRLAYSELLIATLGTWLRHHSVQTAAQGSSSRSSVQTDWHCDRRLSTPRHVPPPVALRYPRGLPRRIGTTATTIGTRRFMFGPRVVSKCTSACCTSHLARRNA